MLREIKPFYYDKASTVKNALTLYFHTLTLEAIS